MIQKRIIPLNKQVIVELERNESVSRGGIFLPDIASQKAPTKGKVFAVSEDSILTGKVEIGDTVLFSKFAGIEVIIPAKNVEEEDIQLQVIKDENILAVIKCEHK